MSMKKLMFPPEDDVIAGGPWVIEDGCAPRRVVLRKLRKGGADEFVVHTQSHALNGAFAHSDGAYFEESQLRKAWAYFDLRNRRLLGLVNRCVECNNEFESVEYDGVCPKCRQYRVTMLNAMASSVEQEDR